MTDREMLELAAKAAGYNAWINRAIPCIWHPNTEWTAWNPLTDDGDAMRLAVKLRFKIVFWSTDGSSKGSVAIYAEQYSAGPFCFEPLGDDPHAATRRAIVRAAAEIGKEMK